MKDKRITEAFKIETVKLVSQRGFTTDNTLYH